MSATRTVPSYLALGCVGALAFTPPTHAQQADQPQRLGTTTVTSTAIDDDEVKVEEAESPKYTQPLLDVPQTITVLSNTTLRQQNLLTLREALTTIPGITFGAGEGGGGYGDSINLRGQSATNDLQIDGVRDSAQYSRSDTFNLEQIEVVNGANSVYAGSGSIGGTINLVTKRPKADDLTIVSGGIGTNEFFRGTIDSNMRVSDTIAVRLNVTGHRNDVADRDVEQSERWGIAPSVTFGIDTPTSLTLLYQHQEDQNTPVYGVPYYSALGGLLPGASYSGYYGYKDVDRQDQTIDLATAILDHRISDAFSVRNLFRLSRIEADIVVNPPQGAYCLANRTTIAGVPCPAGQQAGLFYPSGPRGTTRLTETELLYNQLDLIGEFDTGGIGHNLTLGVAYTTEDYHMDSGNSLRNPGGATPNPALPPISIANPDPVYGGPVNFVRNSRQQGTTNNIAVYLFDAIELAEQFEINGGIRWERNEARFRSDTVTTGGAITAGRDQVNNDDLFSYRIGAVFKPVPNASLYAAYGNSRTPTSASVRGGCGIATAEQALIGAEPCGVEPQEAKNYEIGGKVDLFDADLQLTAALFRNERTNYPVTSNDPSIGNLQVLDGRNRVDGIALGASGRITPEWTIFANYTYLDTEVLQSVSNYCLANPGSSYTPIGTTTPVVCPLVDAQAGNPLTNNPEHSGSLFTTYTLPFGLQVGYGLTYQGSFLLSNTTDPFIKSDDWMTHRFYLAYTMDNGLAAQLNVQNAFEERYFTGIRNNGWAVPGEGRSAVLTLSYSY
ncbi:TonB-dependent receptor [Croceibacterium sp. TMG7-5b_MA50]|uniref:TonB-dependent receptor n=1 Tax=Croceibacterium sp. TMG7-5b_MA50 TaxID=3121290 RepID=UPI003221CD31